MKNIFKLIFCTLLFTACNSGPIAEENNGIAIDKENTVSLSEAQQRNAGITTGKMEKKELSGSVFCNGVLDVPPQNLISISAVYGGFIKSTELLQGMRVKKGQVLCILEHPDYIQLQEDYLDTKSKFNFSKTELERQKELDADNVVSKRSLQERESEYNSLLAKVEGLKQKLALINIDAAQLEKGKISASVSVISPINGYVKEVNVNIGKYVNPHEAMFEIVDTEHLHAELTVFEKDVAKIKEGQKITFSLANEENTIRTATVHLIGRSIGQDKTVRIHGHLDKEDAQLLPGMYIKAEIEIKSTLSNCLPEKALLLINGKNYVFLEKNSGVYELTEVKTGISYNGYTEINENLEPDSRIVLGGARTLYSILKNKTQPSE